MREQRKEAAQLQKSTLTIDSRQRDSNGVRRWMQTDCVFCMLSYNCNKNYNNNSSSDYSPQVQQIQHLSPGAARPGPTINLTIAKWAAAAASAGLFCCPVRSSRCCAASFKTQFALINRRKSILTAYDAQWRAHKSCKFFALPPPARPSRSIPAKIASGRAALRQTTKRKSWTQQWPEAPPPAAATTRGTVPASTVVLWRHSSLFVHF